MEYCRQVSVAPSSRTMGSMKIQPKTARMVPKASAMKKATDSTLLASSSRFAPSRRAM